jgi:hypothetical protein
MDKQLQLLDMIKDQNIDLPKDKLEELGALMAEKYGESGTMDPLEVLARLSQLEHYVKSMKARLSDYAMDELDKYPEAERQAKRGLVIINETSTPAAYNYSVDEEYQHLESQAKEIDKKLKGRKKILDMARNGEVDGVPIVPLARPSRRTLRVTIQKS